jgi:uncharacterized protein (TIGR02679 family)
VSTPPGERLLAVLGGPALAWVRARLRVRMERGSPLSGRITLPYPTPEQRSAVERLFGRLSRGQSLHVDLDELAAMLRAAELGDDLGAALIDIEGPIENRREQQAQVEAQWRAALDDAQRALGAASPWQAWLADVTAGGLLRRLTASDPDEGKALLTAAVAVLARLPAQAVPLAELAAQAVGDSHALDAGAPLATLVLRAIIMREGLALADNTELRRAAWAAAGVLADELSAPVLVLNLRADGTSATGRAFALAAETGEPYRLSTRQLLRDAPAFASIRGTAVFVCENPSVVAAAANRLGRRARPLLCTDGQPKTAMRLLLSQLRQAGVAIAYHGDFDWPGIQMANAMIRKFGATPWRMGTDDYRQAEGSAALTGTPVVPLWDVTLGEAMRQRGRGVHEEAVVDMLLRDLDPHAGGILIDTERPSWQ